MMLCEFSTSSLWPLIRYLQNAPIYHGCHFEIPNLSEKSLQVQLDYSVIINHIQKAWKQMLFTYLPSNKKGNEGGEACSSVASVWNYAHISTFYLKGFSSHKQASKIVWVMEIFVNQFLIFASENDALWIILRVLTHTVISIIIIWCVHNTSIWT